MNPDANVTSDFDPRLVGTWIPIRAITADETRELPATDKIMRIERGRKVTTFTRSRKLKDFVEEFDARPLCDPPQFEARVPGFEFPVGVTHGVYQVDGDELTICWGHGREPRPTEIKASNWPASHWVDVYRRSS